MGDFSTSRALRTTPMSSSSSSGAGPSTVSVETLPSTCTWTQHHSPDGGCELQPRSCYSCLNTRPTSGENCTLTPEGVCMGAAAYDAKYDYRRTWPPGLNYFTAQNATYCEPGDMSCASCSGVSFKNWQAFPSQYCLGYRGCVCVSICENDVWRAAIQPALERALNASTNNSSSLANCTIQRAPSQDNGTAGDVGSLTDFVGLGNTKAIYSGYDPCMWIQNQTFCGVPRSCFDCLNTPLYSGAKCMLHSSGYCTTMTSYDYTKDYRRGGRASNRSIALFPSTNTTYCKRDDETCARCRQDPTFTQWKGVASPPQFCIGANGCVCLASCESPQWQQAVVDLTCNRTAVDQLLQGMEGYKLSPVAFWSVSALSLLAAMICALLALSCIKRCQRNRTQRHRRPSRQPRGPTLELSGWKAMREKLIETERDFVGETHLEGRLHAVSTDSRDPETEPATTAVEPSAALVVEEGDAYRPVSPSRMHV